MNRTTVRLFCTTIAALFLNGCVSIVNEKELNWAAVNAGPVPEYASSQEQAKDAIRRFLKDPDSAQFRDFTPFFKTFYAFGKEPLWAVCVFVNAKNSYGGYTGFQQWIVKFRDGQAIRDELGVMNGALDCTVGPTRGDRTAG